MIGVVELRPETLRVVRDQHRLARVTPEGSGPANGGGHSTARNSSKAA